MREEQAWKTTLQEASRTWEMVGMEREAWKKDWEF